MYKNGNHDTIKEERIWKHGRYKWILNIIERWSFMKKMKNVIIVLILIFAMIAPVVMPVIYNPVTVRAATIKISQKKLTLLVGKSETLSITGTSKKVTWKSNKKSVATVSSKGKVTAVATGTARISATVNNRTYTCVVTVTETNPYLEKAEFEASEINVGDISFVVPTDLRQEIQYDDEFASGVYLYTSSDGSFLIIGTSKSGQKADYDELKQSISNLTLDSIYQNEYVLFGLEDMVLSDYRIFEYKSANGTACALEYMLNHTQKITQYYLCIDNYYINVEALDSDNMDLVSIAEFILDSAMVKVK